MRDRRFPGKLEQKTGMLGTVIVTGTDNVYTTVLATCPCGNTNRGQDHQQKGSTSLRCKTNEWAWEAA